MDKVFFKLKLAATVVFLSSACSGAPINSAKNMEAMKSIQGTVVALQGSCSSIGCASIQYSIATDPLGIKNFKGDVQDFDPDKSMMQLCGPSGLVLGSKYIFLVTDTRPTKAADRPLTVSKEFAQCDLFFDKHHFIEASVVPFR